MQKTWGHSPDFDSGPPPARSAPLGPPSVPAVAGPGPATRERRGAGTHREADVGEQGDRPGGTDVRLARLGVFGAGGALEASVKNRGSVGAGRSRTHERTAGLQASLLQITKGSLSYLSSPCFSKNVLQSGVGIVH